MNFRGNYIGGRFRMPKGRLTQKVSEDPGDLDRPVGAWCFSAPSCDESVFAAGKAFARWSSQSFKNRAAFLNKFSQALKRQSEELAELISREMGKPLEESRNEVERLGVKAEELARSREVALKAPAIPRAQGIRGAFRMRPRGVIAVLCPFNLPAYIGMAQALSAAAWGNTVVVKPSDITPFTGQKLAEICQGAGFPDGVMNFLQGDGMTGRALALHRLVSGVFFTGSWKTGLSIQKALLGRPEKLLALEMGGKNAAIILEDCALEQAVEAAVQGAFLTSGQRCNSTSRIIVARPIAKKFIFEFLKKTRLLKVGYGLEPGTRIGPLAAERVFNRYRRTLSRAGTEGFDALEKSGFSVHNRRGYYVHPSAHLHRGCPPAELNETSYAQSEAFGPNVAIYIVRDLAEAMRLNNHTLYGLATSIFTRSRENFEKVLSSAETGIVHWNVATTGSAMELPFGGLKRSGNHRPMGSFAPLCCTIPTASLENSAT